MKSYYNELAQYKSDELALFTNKLIPDCSKKIIGVTCPNIRKFSKNVDLEFLNNLPHEYHEEDILHAYMISNLNTVEIEALSLISPGCNLKCSYCNIDKANKTSICFNKS